MRKTSTTIDNMSLGNSKLGTDTLIFNMCSALDCPSRKLGLCQLKNPSHCYARKAEYLYPQVLPYRNRQAKLWQGSILPIIDNIRKAIKKYPYIRFFRFNESGDFGNQNEVEKLKCLAMSFPAIKFYGYTARKDLSFKSLPKNLCVNGSNWRRGKMNRLVVVDKPSGIYNAAVT